MLKAFSKKQAQTLLWWCGRHAHHDAVICDGAIRSGKTVVLSTGFVLWAMHCFDDQSFALCGKTIVSVRRNIIAVLLPILAELGFDAQFKSAQNLLIVRWGGHENRFWLFGGKDEGSAALIQGVTLAGVLLDEVALMPRSFVEQALARCSVSGSKYWFSCNPEHPAHWFYREWIQKTAEKNALYLHFTMQDNPTLSPEVLARYETMYSGAFYERYVLGKWVAAQGAVYPEFRVEKHVVKKAPRCRRHLISVDYGIASPCSMGLWGERDGVWYRLREFYYGGRESGDMLTDAQLCAKLTTLAGSLAIEAVIVDPSAASFIAELRRRGKFRVIPGVNNVIQGIAVVGTALRGGKLKFHQRCEAILGEFPLYRWGDGLPELPRKENDHAMDDMRYFAMHVYGTVANVASGFCCRGISRMRN